MENLHRPLTGNSCFEFTELSPAESALEHTITHFSADSDPIANHSYKRSEDFIDCANKWKKNKSHFKKVVLEFNEGKIALVDSEKAALQKLRDFWQSAGLHTDIMAFFDVKEYHTALHSNLLCLNFNSTWDKYISYFQRWRGEVMIYFEQFQEFANSTNPVRIIGPRGISLADMLSAIPPEARNRAD